MGDNCSDILHASSLKSQGKGLGFWVLGFGFQVPSFKSQVSGPMSQVSGFGFGFQVFSWIDYVERQINIRTDLEMGLET